MVHRFMSPAWPQELKQHLADVSSSLLMLEKALADGGEDAGIMSQLSHLRS
ncbi:hypothetical protein MCOR25_010811 [Pyricularia grisea]|nr:hypothetical protein MCOR25_010811 [Pyricularia grisea]